MKMNKNLKQIYLKVKHGKYSPQEKENNSSHHFKSQHFFGNPNKYRETSGKQKRNKTLQRKEGSFIHRRQDAENSKNP